MCTYDYDTKAKHNNLGIWARHAARSKSQNELLSTARLSTTMELCIMKL